MTLRQVAGTFDWSEPRHIQTLDLNICLGLIILICSSLRNCKRTRIQRSPKWQKLFSVNYKTIVWHYTNRVKGNGLIKSYWINWLDTRYDYQLEKAFNRQHGFLLNTLLVKDTSRTENMELSVRLNTLPFIYFETGGSNYSAELAFSLDILNEAYQYIDYVLEPYYEKTMLYTIDGTNAATFSIPHDMYDKKNNKWTFDKNLVIERFTNLVTKIKEVRWE
jgi:hypothetical protein